MAASERHDLRARYDTATAALEPPLAIIDMAAFRANADDLVRRAGQTPVRLASKSIRVRSLLEAALRRPGFRGVLAYSLAEAVWLVDHGVDDIVMGYPGVDRASLARIAAEEELAAAITLCVDDVEQLDLLTAVLGSDHAVLRLCLDIDTSWRPLGLHVGARRSPVREPAQAAALAQEIKGREGFRLVGVMTYEAQIAGIPDAGAPVR
ncbi:MAG: alanine racemase, partial [Actinopolymorphaceae bacterium]